MDWDGMYYSEMSWFSFSCYHGVLSAQTTDIATQATLIVRKYSSTDGSLQLMAVRSPRIDQSTSKNYTGHYRLSIIDYWSTTDGLPDLRSIYRQASTNVYPSKQHRSSETVCHFSTTAPYLTFCVLTVVLHITRRFVKKCSKCFPEQ